jgi:hypothetical protein
MDTSPAERARPGKATLLGLFLVGLGIAATAGVLITRSMHLSKEATSRPTAPPLSVTSDAGEPHGEAGSPSSADPLRRDIRELLRHADTCFRDAKIKKTYSDEGHASYETSLRLAGCSDPHVWGRPDGAVEFTCELVPNIRRERDVIEQIQRRMSDIVAALPREWRIKLDPQAAPYSPHVEAEEPGGRLTITATVVPRVDDTFDATLTLRCLHPA